MKRTIVLLLAFMAVDFCRAMFAADFVTLFNGRDLNGWVNVQCAPSTWTVRDGMIVCSGIPTGVMRTEKQYENFILELEWKHLRKGGNAGLFIWSDPITARGQPFTRAIEVQVLDGNDPAGLWTGHGDVFSIHGATMVPDRPHPKGWTRCLPSELRANPAGEWNHYRVECRDGRLTLAVNGKVVSGASQCNPRKGYICLESEGSEAHFKNIRIQELPSSSPTVSETAPLDAGFKSIYNGVDLSGWRQEAGHKGHWVARDWILDYDGKSEATDKNLWTEKEYGDFELIVDWRFTTRPKTKKIPMILSNGDYAKNENGSPKMADVPEAGYSGFYLRDVHNGVVNRWLWPMGYVKPAQPDLESPTVFPAQPLGEWNRFHVTIRGNQVTIVLNGQTVSEKENWSGILARGPIGIQHNSNPIQIANIYVRELN